MVSSKLFRGLVETLEVKEKTKQKLLTGDKLYSLSVSAYPYVRFSNSFAFGHKQCWFAVWT